MVSARRAKFVFAVRATSPRRRRAVGRNVAAAATRGRRNSSSKRATRRYVVQRAGGPIWHEAALVRKVPNGSLVHNGTDRPSEEPRANQYRYESGLTQCRRAGEEWERFARDAPLAAARSLLECFRTFAEGGFFLDDVLPRQFTLEKRELFLIDAPRVLAGPMLERPLPLFRPFSCRWPPPRAAVDWPAKPPCAHSEFFRCCCERARLPCERREQHTLRFACGATTCARVAPPTNVYDAAARSWALPFVLRVGEEWGPGGAASERSRSRVETLAACMRSPDPAARPSLATALAFLEGVG